MKKLLTFVMLFVSLFAVLAVANTASAAATRTVYFKPNSNWDQAGAWFSAWTWGGSSADEWVIFEDTDNDGYYEGTFKADRTGMKVYRNDSALAHTVANCKWDGTWNSSSKDIAVNSTKNCYNQPTTDTWDGSNGTWTDYVYVAPTMSLVGTLPNASWDPTAEDYVMTESDGIYTITTELVTGEVKFKIVRNQSWSSTFGHSQLQVTGLTVTNDADDNMLANVLAGTYEFVFDSHNLTLDITLVSFELSDLLNAAYNNGTYTRNTHINLAVEDDHVKGDFYQHFHNAKNGTNVFADRTTEFVGDYLYFVETGVGFGTSENNLTEFTWVNGEKTNEKVNSTLPGMEEYFTTLFDFQSIEGWSLVDGVYVNTTAEAIDAAVAFTAPGWKAPANYMTYTQVTASLVDGNLVISLWVNSNADSAKLVADHATSGTNSLFSTATINLAL